MTFCMVVNHFGSFVNEPYLHYKGGEVHVYHGLEIGSWSFFECVDLVKDLGYKGKFKLWWRTLEDAENKYREFLNDNDAMILATYAIDNRCEVFIFVEHVVEEMPSGPSGLLLPIPDPHKEGETLGSQGHNVGAQKKVKSNVNSATEEYLKRYGKGKDVAASMEASSKKVVASKETPSKKAAGKEKGKNVRRSTRLQALVKPAKQNTKIDVVVISSDDSAAEVHFNDSEEEKDLGVDDCFNFQYLGEAETLLNEKIKKMKRKYSQSLRLKGHGGNMELEGRGEDVDGDGGRVEGDDERVEGEDESVEGDDDKVDRKGDSVRVEGVRGVGRDEQTHVMEDDWESEDMASISSGSESEGHSRPHFPRYHPEDMCKEFRFSVGMEFISLSQFKEAILEHSILNGRQITFKKNDLMRCRVVCKRKCEFVMLCSQVGRRKTYRIKTLSGRHTCGRVFQNKNATSKWVASKLVDKVRTTKNMTATEIVDDIRVNFSAGISRFRAWRARKLATLMVNGDARSNNQAEDVSQVMENNQPPPPAARSNTQARRKGKSPAIPIEVVDRRHALLVAIAAKSVPAEGDVAGISEGAASEGARKEGDVSLTP